MANTSVFHNLASTTTTVEVPSMDQSQLNFQKTESSKNGLVTTHHYILNTGVTYVTTTVRVRIEDLPQANKGFGERRVSIWIDTSEEVTDADDARVSLYPVAGLIAINFPGMGTLDPTNLAMMFGNLFGLTFGGLTVGVPDEDFVSQLARGDASLY